MPNHLHLLMREGGDEEPIGKVMRRLGTWYVYRCNRRYQRSGSLFEGRYRSEAVEDYTYFLAVLRYIHGNPVIAGLVASPALYPCSSCAQYALGEGVSLADTGALPALVPRERAGAWHEEGDQSECLDLDERSARRSISDGKALQVMRKASGATNLEEFLRLPDKRRAGALQRMRRAGASLNQIVRLTGTSMALVRQAVNSQKTKRYVPLCSPSISCSSGVRLSLSWVEPVALIRLTHLSNDDAVSSYSRIISLRGFPLLSNCTNCYLNSSV